MEETEQLNGNIDHNGGCGNLDSSSIDEEEGIQTCQHCHTIVKRKLQQTLTCNQHKAKKLAVGMLPFLGIMRKYKWRSDLVNDVMAGLTVGIMQLPQGMAYSLLADVPLYVGLYTCFFPAIAYFFLGTSRHVSMGPAAILSLMTGSFVAAQAAQWRQANGLGQGGLDSNITQEWLDKEADFKVSIAATSAFMAGAAQMLMGFFRVGFLTTYMSESMVQGFTTGAAFLGFTSQIKYMLGLEIERYPNIFQFIRTYIALFKKCRETNVAALLISLTCVLILQTARTLKKRYGPKVKAEGDSKLERTRRRILALMPVELILIVAVTLASHYGDFHARWDVRVVGKIPRRIPSPTNPGFTNVSDYITDSIMIGIVAFAQSISLALLMAREHNYSIDSNQELVGSGLANVVGSFFSCMPLGASISRTSIHNSMGGKTQVSSLVSAAFVMTILIAFGSSLQDLPVCVLSTVIVVSLGGIFLQILTLKDLLYKSPFDCAIWVTAFVSVLVLHVTLGLVVSIVFSFFTVVCRAQITQVTTVHEQPEIDEENDTGPYSTTDIRVVSYASPLYYANAEIFMKKLYHETDVNPRKVKQVDRKEDSQRFIPPFQCLVIDCTAITFIDRAGIEAIEEVIRDFQAMNISIYLGGVRDGVRNMLMKSDFLEKYDCMYLTTKDAWLAAHDGLNCNITAQTTVV